jgi:hypothetical protein
VNLVAPSLALTGTARDFSDSIRPIPYGRPDPHEMVGVAYLRLLRRSLELFGATPFAVRAPSLLGGLLSLFTAALLAGALLPRGGAALAALALAGLRWHLILSFSGWHSILLAPLVDLAALLLVAARRRGGPWAGGPGRGPVGSRRAPLPRGVGRRWPGSRRSPRGPESERSSRAHASRGLSSSRRASRSSPRLSSCSRRDAASPISGARPGTASSGKCASRAPRSRSSPRRPTRSRRPGSSPIPKVGTTSRERRVSDGSSESPWPSRWLARSSRRARSSRASSSRRRSRHSPRPWRAGRPDIRTGFDSATCRRSPRSPPPRDASPSSAPFRSQRAARPLSRSWGFSRFRGARGLRQAAVEWPSHPATFASFHGEDTLIGTAAARWKALGPVRVAPGLGRSDATIETVARYRLGGRGRPVSPPPALHDSARRFRIEPPAVVPEPGERIVERVRDPWGREWAIVLGRKSEPS